MADTEKKQTKNSEQTPSAPADKNTPPIEEKLTLVEKVLHDQRVTHELDEEQVLKEEKRLEKVFSGNSTDMQKPIKMLFRFYKGHYFRLFLACIFFVIKSSPTWILPIITADVINAITRGGDLAPYLIRDGIIVISALALNIPFHMLYVRMYTSVLRSVEAGLRGAMIRKLQSLSISFHKTMESGKVQSKVMRDVETVADISNHIFNTILGVVINMSITLVVVLTKNWLIFLMFLVVVPSSVLVRRMFNKKIRKENHNLRVEIENTASDVFTMEELIPVTRAHALERKEIRKLTADVTGVARTGWRADQVMALFGSVSWVMTIFFQTVCLFFTVFMAYKKYIQVGDISLYQSYFGSLIGYVSSILGLMPTLARGRESITSIGEILGAYDVENYDNKKKLKTLQGKYEFKNVRFNYDERTHVLSDLNLTVEPGETIALVGESGSGKSTIINLVIGFNKIDAGEFLIDGYKADDLDLRTYRKMISVVPQNTILFNGTVRENITYGNNRVTKEQLDYAIKAARLESVIASLPDGLDTIVGEHGAKLSGGQRQRVSIARAIIRDPRVIIFDEATSALDSVTEREIQAAIDNLTANRTTFIVAHRLSTIKNADKIAVIRDGHCVEYGTWDELLEKKGEFYAYKKAQE